MPTDLVIDEAILVIGADGDPRHETPEDLDLTLEFRDVAGRRWRRKPDGQLVRLGDIAG